MYRTNRYKDKNRKFDNKPKGVDHFAHEAKKRNPKDYIYCPFHPTIFYNFKKYDECFYCHRDRLDQELANK